MGFAYDKLYEEFIRPHMPEFVDKVKVREILPFLCCLTSSDQEEIWAQTDMRGNGAGMQVLLDCIRRRENWPEDLIQALKMRKHTTLANRMEEKYESLKAPHIRSALTRMVLNPLPNFLSVLGPLEYTAMRSVPETCATEATSLFAPFQPVATPAAVTMSPPPQTASSSGTLPNHTGSPPVAGLPYIPPVTSEPHRPVQLSSLSSNSVVHASSAAVTPPSPQVSLVKPVQDTNSPKALGDAGAQEQVVKCTATFDQFDIKQAHQEEECRRQPVLLLQSLPGSSDWPNHSGSRGPSLCRSGPDAWEDECFSKPGVLRSVPPPSRMQAAVLEGPYSGDSARLQISSFSATLSNHNPGSVTPSHWGPRPKELEKNQYDPAPQGFDARRDVWENVVHVSEGAAVQNYAGQDPRTGEETPAGTLTENAHPLSPSPLGPGLQWLHGGQGAVPQISFLMAAAVTVLAVLVMLWSSV